MSTPSGHPCRRAARPLAAVASSHVHVTLEAAAPRVAGGGCTTAAVAARADARMVG